MLRNTFFALCTVLAAAASSQAAIILETSLAPTQPTEGGLVALILTATADAGETINGIQDPHVRGADGGAGLHQAWAPFSVTGTPTRGDQTAPLWNDAWLPYDSHWFFTPANSLNVGGPLTETNNSTDGVSGLPDGVAGPPVTGFGALGPDVGKASSFTVASGLQGSSVALGQLVLKAGEAALVDLRISTAQGGAANQTFTDFRVGGAPVIPEPSTIALLGLAMVGFVGLRRRS